MKRLALLLVVATALYLIGRRRRELYDTWPHAWLERREVAL